MLELAGREVHTDLERDPELLLPGLRLAARLLEHQPVDGHDGAVVLGQLDEVRRQQKAVLGVVPAHQRLRTDDAAVGQGDEGLVVHLYFAPVDDVA